MSRHLAKLRKKRTKRTKGEHRREGLCSLLSPCSHRTSPSTNRTESGLNPDEPRRGGTIRDADLDRFVARLRARLEAGATTYGDTSFTRPAAELVDEIQQELEDVAGWGFLLWIRLDRLRGAVEQHQLGEEDHD
jgi:hypothetical protein